MEGSGHDTAARVAREAIQNSVDATLPDTKTEVLIRNMTLSRQEVTAFRKLLGFDAIDSPLARLEKLGLSSPNALTRLRDGVPVQVTIVEDRNTCGLGYDERDKKDRFEELCLSLGQDTTSVSSGKGGSYGLGKAVYEEASDCNMFVVYSIFEPSAKTGGHHARLFACATFDGHWWKGNEARSAGSRDSAARKYTGRALFGVHEDRQGGQPVCRPIVDDMAHEIAEQVGFTRTRDEHGTSIMIIGSSIDIGEFRTAVEQWWWPRLLSNKLTVELCMDNDLVRAPAPLAVAELEAHITCYTMIEHSVPLSGPREKKLKFHRFQGLQPGQLALKGADDQQPIEADDSPDDLFQNSVALIRSGPLMVVKYLKLPSAGDQKGVGVFLGDPDADEALHLSEPPSHDTWNPNSQRLRDAYPDDQAKRELLQKLVERILRRIKEHTQKFLKDLNPKPEPPVARGSRRLEQILASVMSAEKLGRPPPPPVLPDPFEIRIREGRQSVGSESVATARVGIKLKEDASAERVLARVSVVPAVVLDDNRRRDGSGRIPLASFRVDGEEADLASDGVDTHADGVDLVVWKDREIVVDVTSESFNSDYYASLDVVVAARSEAWSADDDPHAGRPESEESSS